MKIFFYSFLLSMCQQVFAQDPGLVVATIPASDSIKVVQPNSALAKTIQFSHPPRTGTCQFDLVLRIVIAGAEHDSQTGFVVRPMDAGLRRIDAPEREIIEKQQEEVSELKKDMEEIKRNYLSQEAQLTELVKKFVSIELKEASRK